MALNLAGIGLGSAFDFAKGILDRFWPKQMTEAEKTQAMAQLVPLIEKRDNEIVNAKKEIIVAEMQQGDKYTKRARPTVVYGGLAIIAFVHVLIPLIISIMEIIMVWSSSNQIEVRETIKELDALRSLDLPTAFWTAWGSVVSIWSIGRSAERRGAAGKLIEAITGNKS